MDNAFIATNFDWDHRNPTGWQRGLNRVFRKLRLPVRLTPAPADMANIEARMNLFHLLEQTAAYRVPGDVVDLGCNAGDSTIVMRTVIDRMAPEKQVHAFDSFEGLPELTANDRGDGVYAKGYMAAGLDLFTRKFEALGLRMPQVHKGWFEETVPRDLPDRISFALIDGDLYESTRHVLPHVYDRMAPGAIGMLAVYYDENILPRSGIQGGYRSPGVKRACDEFFADKPEQVSVLYANEYSNGYFRKQ
ncbi:MAG: class I SAM-dependent methyltransferase [Flavobacteriales bacterium]|nr:class I SAM-dependent methyltransferase [Flavobacteriales bacterium]MCB9193540.1 class I SAM-dependent methyltransferase [Flavobacteriales bacterium]